MRPTSQDRSRTVDVTISSDVAEELIRLMVDTGLSKRQLVDEALLRMLKRLQDNAPEPKIDFPADAADQVVLTGDGAELVAALRTFGRHDRSVAVAEALTELALADDFTPMPAIERGQLMKQCRELNVEWRRAEALQRAHRAKEAAMTVAAAPRTPKSVPTPKAAPKATPIPARPVPVAPAPAPAAKATPARKAAPAPRPAPVAPAPAPPTKVTPSPISAPAPVAKPQAAAVVPAEEAPLVAAALTIRDPERPFTSACIVLRTAQAEMTKSRVHEAHVKNAEQRVAEAKRARDAAEELSKEEAQSFLQEAISLCRLSDAESTLAEAEKALAELHLQRSAGREPGDNVERAEKALRRLIAEEYERMTDSDESKEFASASAAAMSLFEGEWAASEPWMQSGEGQLAKAAARSVVNEMVRSEIRMAGAEIG